MKKSKVSKSAKTVEKAKNIRDELEASAVSLLVQENKPIELTEQEKQVQFKDLLLANINKSDFVMPFFSDLMYATLLTENKVINFPALSRQSNYNSLPSLMPYNEEFQQRGFAMSRGRIFMCLCLNKSASEIISFDIYNRKLENSQLKHANIHRKILAVSKAYFPLIHKEIKTLYPKSAFKGQE
jgi:hypothetical protein